jgi:peptide/nickel transport system substrate-binding protein
VVGACGSDDDGGGDRASADDTSAAEESGGCTEDRLGGDITMATFSESGGLDPTVSTGTGLTGDTEMAAIYDVLVRFDPESGEYDPQVAESLEPNDDFTEWALTLRPDIAFGNGDPLTTEAVRSSIERHLDPENHSVKAGQVANIADMRIVDERSMIFVLTSPWTGFPYLLASQVGMITNPALVTQLGETLNIEPVGAGVGPFEIQRNAPGEEIVMTAKEDYWGGAVCIDTLRFVPITGAGAAYDAFRNGEVDLAILRDPTVISQARDDGFEGFSTLQNMGGQILINGGALETEPVTADVRVRRAVAHALDPEVINERAFGGNGLPTSAILGELSRFFSGSDGPAYDPERAREIVDEVKAEGRWDGTLHLVCANSQVEVAIATEALLEAAGFEVNAETSLNQPDQINRVISQADYDIACWGNNLYDDSDPWTVLDYQLRSTSRSNYRGYASSEWDAALDELKRARDLAEQKAALATLQQVWNESVPSANFATTEVLVATGDHVRNVRPSQEAMLLLDDAYVEE